METSLIQVNVKNYQQQLYKTTRKGFNIYVILRHMNETLED